MTTTILAHCDAVGWEPSTASDMDRGQAIRDRRGESAAGVALYARPRRSAGFHLDDPRSPDGQERLGEAVR